jgi:hypothetical protein
MPTLQELQAKAAHDEAFRAALLRDPYGTLAGEGIEVPAGVEVTVVEATPERVTLVLPPPVADDELDEDALAGSAGGTVGWTAIFNTYPCPG